MHEGVGKRSNPTLCPNRAHFRINLRQKIAGVEEQLRGLELQVLEVFARHPPAQIEHLYADDVAIGVIVQYHPGLDLLGFNDLRFIEAKIQRIVLLVDS